jgi:hypothetical protein
MTTSIRSTLTVKNEGFTEKYHYLMATLARLYLKKGKDILMDLIQKMEYLAKGFQGLNTTLSTTNNSVPNIRQSFVAPPVTKYKTNLSHGQRNTI